jgi:alpha-tubulin suppressor-like RCC1 family protein
LGNGECNNEDEDDVKYIQDPILLGIGSCLKVIKLVCGAGHSLVLTHTELTFLLGCSLLGSLGLGDTNVRVCPLNEIAFQKDRIISDISSGAGHCLALDTYGGVYSWGASADF